MNERERDRGRETDRRDRDRGRRGVSEPERRDRGGRDADRLRDRSKEKDRDPANREPLRDSLSAQRVPDKSGRRSLSPKPAPSLSRSAGPASSGRGREYPPEVLPTSSHTTSRSVPVNSESSSSSSSSSNNTANNVSERGRGSPSLRSGSGIAELPRSSASGGPSRSQPSRQSRSSGDFYHRPRCCHRIRCCNVWSD